ncbi:MULTISPECIES: hypothetical protein [Corynebacterium]|uniref:hypothetical protein n=1 Tax=Corynebacterium TaxID=1716 RepID=UPI001313E746|nr:MULTISPECIES: hypothetical protein [Corynebacterium]
MNRVIAETLWNSGLLFRQAVAPGTAASDGDNSCFPNHQIAGHYRRLLVVW